MSLEDIAPRLGKAQRQNREQQEKIIIFARNFNAFMEGHRKAFQTLATGVKNATAKFEALERELAKEKSDG